MRLRRIRYLVHPATNEVCKFFPHNPPRRGDTVLVDHPAGIGRCRVVKDPKIDWGTPSAEGYPWTLRGPILVEPEKAEAVAEAPREGRA